MSLIYFFASTRAEGRSVIPPAAAGNNRVEVFITGVGPGAARRAAAKAMAGTRARSETPAAILVIGTCGSLSAELPEGSVVIYSSCIPGHAASGECNLTCSPLLITHMKQALGGRGIAGKTVVGITRPTVAARREDKLLLASRGAQVVDMESYEILSVAGERGVPAAVLRVVSDSLDRSLPDFTFKPSGSLNVLRTSRIVVGQPLTTVRLALAQRRALRKLKEAVSVLLAADILASQG
ncbi:MAG: hypothetical protein KGM47_13025 [Acidobacteriota bacterium]|nr:hypothetical protein [Acidobacteriota bacterium]